MYGNRLTREYGDSAPSTWANAINSLSPYELERGMRRLLHGGSGSPPTLPQFVKACKLIGDDGNTSSPLPVSHRIGPEYSPVHCHAQMCLFAFLWERGGASESSLLNMIEAKKRIVADFELIATEEKITGSEIRDSLFKAWDPLWQSMPAAEQARHRDHFQRTGYASNPSIRMEHAA